MKFSILFAALSIFVYGAHAQADCTTQMVAGSTASLSFEESYEVVCDNESPMVMTGSEAEKYVQKEADDTGYLKRLQNEREDARLEQKMAAKQEEALLRQQMESVNAKRPKPPISY